MILKDIPALPQHVAVDPGSTLQTLLAGRSILFLKPCLFRRSVRDPVLTDIRYLVTLQPVGALRLWNKSRFGACGIY
jgi:hypothetical protein